MENAASMVSVEHKSVPESRQCLFQDTGNTGNINSPTYFLIFSCDRCVCDGSSNTKQSKPKPK